MALCDNCMFLTKNHDEFRQMFDDTIVIDGDERQKHYCPMYNDHIPFDIFYENADCPYYIPQGDIQAEGLTPLEYEEGTVY